MAAQRWCLVRWGGRWVFVLRGKGQKVGEARKENGHKEREKERKRLDKAGGERKKQKEGENQR